MVKSHVLNALFWLGALALIVALVCLLEFVNPDYVSHSQFINSRITKVSNRVNHDCYSRSSLRRIYSRLSVGMTNRQIRQVAKPNAVVIQGNHGKDARLVYNDSQRNVVVYVQLTGGRIVNKTLVTSSSQVSESKQNRRYNTKLTNYGPRKVKASLVPGYNQKIKF